MQDLPNFKCALGRVIRYVIKATYRIRLLVVLALCFSFTRVWSAAELLARLFSRPRPENVDTSSGIGALFDAFDQIQSDSQMFDENLRAIKDRLIKEHGFKLTTEDETTLAYIFRAFYVGGPELGYSNVGFPVRSGVPRLLPTYEEL